MKVKKAFYCSKEKKAYKVGQKYTGKRKDIKAYLEAENKQHPKTKKGAIEKK